ncbi:ImmA/IrrE family metallo-endopeptidase [Gemmata sp. G18]|uniref:ImmA/IrrE family metallo-endopeptidase n=1 Tax=Gemmata palustris TaxID=2822762 RepID=A0ABS5BW00_9BACT|nr:ImmA/IrrE family metallo-endopeptidase [Gemmata palustris]MBP3957848.1 ImmA/IrrE family metallo-endopeptidase [Gemmata palustris]
MSHVSAAVASIYRKARRVVDPVRRGPVPLADLFDAAGVSHVALPALSLSAVAEHLLAERYVTEPRLVADLLDDRQPLAGLIFRLGGDGLAFVSADDILARRRFTAAHELGHFLLHRDRMTGFIADVTISETDEGAGDLEPEANRFAAELLMPEEVIRARATELQREHQACPRLVLAYRLASELLVSREAMRYRLKTLGVGDDD